MMADLRTINVGHRPLPTDRCPMCGKLDADASWQSRMAAGRVDQSSGEHPLFTYSMELCCRTDQTTWNTTWSFAASDEVPNSFHAIGLEA